MGMMMPPMGGGGAAGGGAVGAAPVAPDASKAASRLNPKRRTVFVLMFVWRDSAAAASAEAAPESK